MSIAASEKENYFYKVEKLNIGILLNRITMNKI